MVGEGTEGKQNHLAPEITLLEACSDPEFKRQLFATAIFVVSTRLRLERFKTYMDEFRTELENELEKENKSDTVIDEDGKIVESGEE